MCVCSSASTGDRCQITAAAHLSGRRTWCVCLSLKGNISGDNETSRQVGHTSNTHSVCATCHIKPLARKLVSTPPSLVSVVCFLLLLWVYYSTLLRNSLYYRKFNRLSQGQKGGTDKERGGNKKDDGVSVRLKSQKWVKIACSPVCHSYNYCL